jgi:hypothetical protein
MEKKTVEEIFLETLELKWIAHEIDSLTQAC